MKYRNAATKTLCCGDLIPKMHKLHFHLNKCGFNSIPVWWNAEIFAQL